MLPATHTQPTKLGHRMDAPYTSDSHEADPKRERLLDFGVRAVRVALDLLLIGSFVTVLWWSLSATMG